MDTIVYTNLSPELAAKWEQEWLAREAYKLARKRTQECIMKESKVKDFKDEMAGILNGLESAGESKPQEPITLEEPLTLEDSIKSNFQDWLEEIEDGLTSDGYTDVKVDGYTNHRVDGTGLNRIEGQYSIEWRGGANPPDAGVKRNHWNEADIKLPKKYPMFSEFQYIVDVMDRHNLSPERISNLALLSLNNCDRMVDPKTVGVWCIGRINSTSALNGVARRSLVWGDVEPVTLCRPGVSVVDIENWICDYMLDRSIRPHQVVSLSQIEAIIENKIGVPKTKWYYGTDEIVSDLSRSVMEELIRRVTAVGQWGLSKLTSTQLDQLECSTINGLTPTEYTESIGESGLSYREAVQEQRSKNINWRYV